jgi:transposase
MMPEHESRGEARLRVPDRSQFTMEMACPDDLVAPGHRVRVVWDVACRLDLSALLASVKARAGHVGRDATDPRLLVALWLYAATRGVGSARELARLCGESRPYRWLCGGVTVNHRLLGEFRVGHAAVLDDLFTQVVASLVRQGLVTVSRIAQDGTRVRAFAGQKSFRSGERLDELLGGAKRHVEELRAVLDDPARSAGLGTRHRAAKRRAAADRVRRIEAAVAQLPELKRRQETTVKKLGGGKVGRARAAKRPRASTTDPEARVMRMPGGEFRPAYNVQLATDTASRAIVGVGVVNEGVDAGRAAPMRDQVERRTGGRHVDEHLLDGGYLVLAEIDASRDGGGTGDGRDVTLYVPPKPPRDREARGSAYEPRPTDTPARKAWRARMGGEEGKRVYAQRGSTIETVNADLKTHRGLGRLLVRGIGKVTCVALWSALAYNVMHFGAALGA